MNHDDMKEARDIQVTCDACQNRYVIPKEQAYTKRGLFSRTMFDFALQRTPCSNCGAMRRDLYADFFKKWKGKCIVCGIPVASKHIRKGMCPRHYFQVYRKGVAETAIVVE